MSVGIRPFIGKSTLKFKFVEQGVARLSSKVLVVVGQIQVLVLEMYVLDGAVAAAGRLVDDNLQDRHTGRAGHFP